MGKVEILTAAQDCSVWIPTHKSTGRINKLSGFVLFKDDIEFVDKLSSDWEWREYRLLPVNRPYRTVAKERKRRRSSLA